MMPYIQTRTNCKIDKEKELKIKERLGEAIEILHKSEEWLMIEFVPECNMYFRGTDEELIAYVDIKIYGRANTEDYEKMTQVVTNILSTDLEIKPDNIYISYSEYSNWGWNGHNF